MFTLVTYGILLLFLFFEYSGCQCVITTLLLCLLRIGVSNTLLLDDSQRTLTSSERNHAQDR